MQIAICDDDSVFRESLKAVLVDYCKDKRIAADYFEFSDTDSLLKKEILFDVIFLDFRFQNGNGMEAAKTLRSRNFTGCIIFITGFPQFVYDSFEVQPFRFFVKPIDETKLRSALDQFLQSHRMMNHIVINQDGEQITLDAGKILYLEGDGKYCLIRTNDEVYHSSKTLSQVQKMLPQHCFYRIHKSYVVNMYCVASIHGSELLLTNGERASIGRSHLSNFKKSYMEFVRNYYIQL